MRTRRMYVVLFKEARLWLLAVPALIALVVYLWGPLVTTIIDSFYSFKGLNATHFDGLNNYRTALANPDLSGVFLNTLKYVGWSLVIGYPLPIVIAIVISELPRLRGLFRICVYFPAVVPTVITGLMWLDIYSPGPGGVLNQLLSKIGIAPSALLGDPHLSIVLIVVTMTWGGFGATTILYLAALGGINRELYEAAAVDGAGFLRRTWSITLTQLRPIMSLFLVLQIVGVFQVFIQPLVMTNGGPSNASNTLVLLAYRLAFEFYQPGEADVVGVFTFLVLFVMTIFYLRSNSLTGTKSERSMRRSTRSMKRSLRTRDGAS